MNSDRGAQPALIPARPADLARAGATSLTARGRADLLKREQAESWLRKGLQILESVPADPYFDLAAKLQTTIPGYLKQVVTGVSPRLAAQNLGMTAEEQELAHVAYFFMPDKLWKVGEDREESGRMVPSPGRMDYGIFTQATMEKIAKLALELDKPARGGERKLAVLKERDAALSEAFRCFEEGHRLDPTNGELLYWLAESYRVGKGVPADEEKSIELFRRASEIGYARAQRAMGDAHAQIGFYCLPKDQAKAAKWWESAAKLGDREALNMIVCCYQNGLGVEQDHSAAARLLRQAADRGDETAQHNLKVLFEEFGAPYEGSGDTTTDEAVNRVSGL